MGAWGSLPWHNDTAADWFGVMFAETKLAERVEKTLKLNARKHCDEIRAAASVVLLLGHNYVWPVRCLERHQLLAAKRLEELLKKNCFCGDSEAIQMVRSEIACPRARASRKTPKYSSKKMELKWWQQIP